MSEEQLSALLAKLKDDAVLLEKLKGAADLDSAVAIAKDAGFDVNKADWLKYQAKQTLELSDEELDSVSGGASYYDIIRQIQQQAAYQQQLVVDTKAGIARNV